MSSPADIPAKRWGLSLDAWAVIVALVLALLVRVGIVTRVPG
jgi:hypothetical protein